MDNTDNLETTNDYWELKNGMPIHKWYEYLKKNTEEQLMKDMEESKMNRITMAKKLYDKVRVYTDEYTSAQLWRKYALMTDEELAEEYNKEFVDDKEDKVE